MPRVTALDHIVLTVADPAATVRFYGALGMTPEHFTGADGAERLALTFGAQKINLHRAGAEIAPHAARPAPGTADICLLSSDPPEAWVAHLAAEGITVELGPVPRTGATGPIISLYLRDPDGTLVEIGCPG
ncbi:MAG: VOC family protein [Pseudomonadota bacterium]